MQGQGQDGQDHHLHAGREGREIRKISYEGKEEKIEEGVGEERAYDGHLSAIQHRPTTTLRTIWNLGTFD